MSNTKSEEILLVISDMQNGGTQKIVRELFLYWKNNGYKIKIITFDKKFGSYNKSIKKFSFSLEMAKRSKTFFHSIFYNIKRIIALRKIIKKNSNSYILSFLCSTNVITTLAKLGLKNKLIICERNDMEHQNIGIIWHIFRRIFYRFADKIITNSEKNYNMLKRYTKKSRIYFIANHILQKKLPNKKPEKVILSVGRLHPQKGFPELIKAYALTKASYNKWKLVIVGKGPEEKNLKKLVNILNLKNKISFKGFVNPYSWYKKSTLFVLSSRFEGAPNALLEAMSMKLPVIITNNCPGGMYYVKNKISGLVVPGSNIPALAKAIDKIIINKKLRNKLATGAIKYIQNLADHKKIFKQWDQSVFN